MSRSVWAVLAFAISSLYLVASFLIVGDYGIGTDGPPSFGIAEKYLYFYETGHLDFQDDLPYFEGHPNFYDNYTVRRSPLWAYPFPNVLSAVSCRAFFLKLHWFDAITAHHIAIPILVTPFLYLLFVFVKKYWGGFAGLMALLCLITYPHFFGHTFVNRLDVTQTILFAATVMLFAEWTLSGKVRYLYAAFVMWGLALATKMEALLIPAVLILWRAGFLWRFLFGGVAIKTRTLFHCLAGMALAAVIVAVQYPTLLIGFSRGLGEGLEQTLLLFREIFTYLKVVGRNNQIGWNLYAPEQIFFVTPPATLLFFGLGFLWAIFEVRNHPLHSLLVVWMLVPVLRHCLPGANHYDGIRHFLIFVVPFSILAALGVDRLRDWLLKSLPAMRFATPALLTFLILMPNLHAIVSTHPYQNTYFNSFAGGLGGAQEKGIPFSYDYWMNSYRKAGEWLDRNARPDAHYFAFPEGELLKYHITRDDLKRILYYKTLPDVPHNTYAVVVPKHDFRLYPYEKILAATKGMEIVHQIKSQGGEILTIYYRS